MMSARMVSEEQEAIAGARYVRMSPGKVRRVVDLIRGRHVDDARRVLRFTPRGAAPTVAKVLESAIANAEHNRGLPGDELVVTRAWVNEGPTLKRFRPRALGRATRIRKRTCHISIVVGRTEEEAPESTQRAMARKASTRRGASTRASGARTAGAKSGGSGRGTGAADSQGTTGTPRPERQGRSQKRTPRPGGEGRSQKRTPRSKGESRPQNESEEKSS
jgi:large subunit ribosomal protein L22